MTVKTTTSLFSILIALGRDPRDPNTTDAPETSTTTSTSTTSDPDPTDPTTGSESTSSSSGASSTGSDTGTMPEPGDIYAPCESAADCSREAADGCWVLEDERSGEVIDGFCTKFCKSDGECPSIDWPDVSPGKCRDWDGDPSTPESQCFVPCFPPDPTNPPNTPTTMCAPWQTCQPWFAHHVCM